MKKLSRPWLRILVLTPGLLFGLSCAHPCRPEAGGQPPALAAMDPQKVEDQDDMTWQDYHPIPGVNWADPARQPTVKLMRIAVLVADFDDQPFVMTLPRHSDLFGNPQIDPVRRADVAKFYADFWNKPQAVNRGHTLHEYWMEQSRGRMGVSVTPFGPYHMPLKMFQYGLAGQQRGAIPSGYAPARQGALNGDVDALWKKDAGKDIGTNFDIVLRIYAGYDETCLWQEFGEMKFQTRDDITPEFGNPDTNQPRWVVSRYMPWTSWKAAEMLWSESSIIQGECSGSIRHEISHFAFRIGDNNNNPYVTPYRRAGAGPWDIMDRGSFNGPGGPHRRWLVPVMEGGSMPAGLMLRQKLNFKFIDTNDVLRLTRGGLAESGLAVTEVVAREVARDSNTFSGLVVRLDGASPQDRTPPDDPATNALSPGHALYKFYSLETIQRIGYDSFCPDSGVLIAKNKDAEGSNGGTNGFNCFDWVIDAHPEDMNKLDFQRPNGEPVMRTIADYRQLNDALFHAGLNSGSQYEYEDAPNRLHFYVIDLTTDHRGVRTYTLGARSLDGSGPQQRGVALAGPAAATVRAANSPCVFFLKNTGAAAPANATAHPPGAAPWLDSDIYRLSVAAEGEGWSAQLRNGLAAVKFGASAPVAVYVSHAANAVASGTIILTATSEGDAAKKATAVCQVTK
jgi:M6 family metalloprotease-like protein